MSKENKSIERFNLITKDLQEVLGETQLKLLLEDPLYEPTCYWGTACTGQIHLGYILPMLKIADIIEAGCKVKILIADLHAYLDSMKSSLFQLEKRTEYYIAIMNQLLIRLNVDTSKIEFIKGSSFQLNKDYTMDIYRANSIISYAEARHAGAEVVRQSDNPVINSLLYPSLQVIDMYYLNADIFLGGIDQRKINVFGLELLPKLGYKKGIYLMNPMLPALSRLPITNESKKMSSSDINSKIDILDPTSVIKKKINQSYCLLGDVTNNVPLVIAEKIVFPVLRKLSMNFTINRPEKYGGKSEYDNFFFLHDDFKSGKLHPADLKMGLIEIIDFIVDPIRKKFKETEFQNLLKTAYNNE